MTQNLLPRTKNKTRYKLMLMLLLSLGAVNFLSGQVSPAWLQLAGPADYANYDVNEVGVGVDTLGNVYTAASAFDSVHNMTKAVLVKYNGAGARQWIKFYDDANLSYNDKQVAVLLVDKAGNSYLCGYGRTNASTATTKDFIVMKYDNTGSQLWVRTWDGGHSDYDYITCAAFDAAGNIVVAGYAQGGSNGDDISVVKYGTSGTQIWTSLYNNPASNGEDRPLAIACDAASNVFITGSSYGANARDMITIKLNSAGAVQWTRIVPHATSGSDERGYGVIADAAGNCYATGAAGDWLTIKYNAAGTVLWTNRYTTNALNDTHKKVMLDRHSNVIVAGDAFALGGHFSDLVVFKLYNLTGSPLWAMNVNNGGVDRFTDAVLDTSGNVYVGGYFEGPQGTDMSAMIVSQSGLLSWNAGYTNSGRAAGDDRPYQVAVDKSRNFYMAGLTETSGSGSMDAVDVITLKYSAAVTGIKASSFSAVQLSVYPNPAKDHVTLSATDAKVLGAVVSISNTTGQLVKEETLSALTQQIDVGQLPKGMYLVKVSGAHGFATSKLIIE